MADLLGIATSALYSYQMAITATSNNIANVNTAGYSVEKVNLKSTAQGGVSVQSVERQYSSLLLTQLNSAAANSSYYETYQAYAEQLSSMLGDDATGISTPLSELFSALQDLSNDAGSSTARQAFLSAAEQLSDTFNSLDAWLRQMGDGIQATVETDLQRVNELTASIAELNDEVATAVATGQSALELQDQRDQLISELSTYVKVNVIELDDGQKNVFLANGQPIVNGDSVYTLELAYDAAEADQLTIKVVSPNGVASDVTSVLQGGEIGALLNFNTSVLQPALNDLGLLAISIAGQINDQQERGMNLDGELGQALFTFSEPKVTAASGNASTLNASFNDVSKLTGDDYYLTYDGSVWNLQNAASGESVSMSGSGTASDPFLADGLEIVIEGTAAAGDNYLLQPSANGAASIRLAVYDVKAIAAASPIIAAADNANTGSAALGDLAVTDSNNAAFQTSTGELSPPIGIVFTSESTYDLMDFSDPDNPLLIESGIAYDPDAENSLFPTPGGINYGYSLNLSGSAEAGDAFYVSYNSGGTADNRNALSLAGLQSDEGMLSGQYSFSDFYGQLVGGLADEASRSETSALAAAAVLTQATVNRESLSGVNLDEEAANLVRYQQAYDAAAQIIQIADELFATILSVARG